VSEINAVKINEEKKLKKIPKKVCFVSGINAFKINEKHPKESLVSV